MVEGKPNIRLSREKSSTLSTKELKGRRAGGWQRKSETVKSIVRLLLLNHPIQFADFIVKSFLFAGFCLSSFQPEIEPLHSM